MTDTTTDSECQLCGRPMLESERIPVHLKSEHPTSTRWICSPCNERCKGAGALRTIVAGILAAALALSAAQAQAEPHKQRDYVLRRQQIGAVRGTPAVRRYIGRRHIDVYRSGVMFEKDAVVGVSR
jgi:hypothetical protein